MIKHVQICIVKSGMVLTQKYHHLLWRAGFGPSPYRLNWPSGFKPEKVVQEMLKESEKEPDPFTVVGNLETDSLNAPGDKNRMNPEQETGNDLAAERRRQIQQKNRQATRSLNLAWLNEMAQSPAQIREKISLFWHGHFACRNLNGFFQQQLINTIRKHALSDFGTLLHAVSKSPAMLQFLNNQQNRKGSPNENFAREVMELFTIGREHYTESDVREAARAFTGWGFSREAAFQFRPFQHDTGIKTVLGKTGILSGEEVLNHLLSQKQTAIFICTKLYRFYVNDNVNSKHVAWLAGRFYESGYQIKPLLYDLFTAGWFYDPVQVGTRIKSPVEWLTGLRRQLPMRIGNEDILLLLQRALGQVLFYPPNVAGWPGGKNWIDSSSLLLRMQLPQLLSSHDGIDLSLKADDDSEMGMSRRVSGALNRFFPDTRIDWEIVLSAFAGIPESEKYERIASAILQTKRLPQKKLIETLTNNSSDTRRLLIALISMPEYQLC